jgi:predicted nucleic-acid-binding protein
LKPGDRVKFFVHPDGTVVLLPKRPVSALRGIIKSDRPPPTIEEMDGGNGGRRGRGHVPPQSAMIGLDANVLIRYLAQDDPVQSARATQIIEGRLTLQNQGFISVVAMVETVWVLERFYRLADLAIAATIERILQSETLVIESEQEVFTAMVALKEGQGSFADALIGSLGTKAGCTFTLTFDRRAPRLHGFEPA